MENREKILGQENIGKLLFKLSLPATIGMIFNALYNIVDTIFVGRGVDALAIGALTVAFPIQIIIMSISMLIGMGLAANISIVFGKGDLKKVSIYAGNGYAFMFIISVLITIFGLIFMEPILKIFGASDRLLEYSKDYMYIIFFGVIVNTLTMVNNNVLRAEGNAKASMIIMVVGTCCNIILDPIFIILLKLGIKGAAMATVISQYLGFIIALYYLFKGNSIINLSRDSFRIRIDYLKDIFELGFPSFIRQVAASFLSIIVNNSIVTYGGDIALSAYGIVNRVLMFIFMPMFGIVQGLQPIVGFNYGAKKINRVKDTIKISIKYLVIYCSIGLGLILLLNRPIISIFTNSKEVIEIGSIAIKIIFIAIPIVGIQIVSSSFFQSVGKSRPALILSLLRQVIILIPLILILPRLFNWGLFGIWISYPIADIISTIISFILLKKEIENI